MNYEIACRRVNIAWAVTAIGWILTALMPPPVVMAGWCLALVAWGFAWFAVEQV